MAVPRTQLLFLVLVSLAMIDQPEVLAARSLEQSAAASMKEQVLSYWRAAMGGSSPQGLESWVSPLSISQTNLFESKIEAGKLVKYSFEAENFCSTSDLICGSNVDALEDFELQFLYTHGQKVRAATPEDVKAEQNSWFVESDLADSEFRVPSTIPEFVGAATRPAFLPRALVEALGVPTASNVNKLMSELHIPQGSALAAGVEHTSAVCDKAGEEPMEGEMAACITSLEQLADFLAQNFPTLKDGGVELMGLDSVSASASFKVVRTELKADVGSAYLVGHPSVYPYYLVVAHHLPETKVYSIRLESDEGYSHTGAALCHMNTAEWSPSHVAFQVLGTKPGAGGICHWVHADGFLVVPSPKLN